MISRRGGIRKPDGILKFACGHPGSLEAPGPRAAGLTRSPPMWYKPTMHELLGSLAGSALLRTLGAFALMLLLARLKLPLAAGIMIGTVVLAAAFALGPGRIALSFLEGAIHPRTVSLVIITAMILALSEVMRAGGQFDRIMALASTMLRRPLVAMAALPALIGLLPMPGGALFSAPMVDSAARGGNLSGGMLSAINYWYRHIWEHWWPIYPGVITTLVLTGSGLGKFIACQLPLGIIMTAAGLWIFRGVRGYSGGPAAHPASGSKWRLLSITSSIWLIVVVYAPAAWLVKALPLGSLPYPELIQQTLPLALGLLVSLAWTCRLNKLGAAAIGKALLDASTLRIIVLVIGVMVFQHVLGKVDAAPQIAGELNGLRVPPVVVVAVLPFVAGMVTGLAIGFVGVSFPIVLGLVESIPDHGSIRPFVALAYAFGHLGQMLSPMHLCQVLSNQYFGTGFGPLYRRIAAPAALTALGAVGYFILLGLILG